VIHIGCMIATAQVTISLSDTTVRIVLGCAVVLALLLVRLPGLRRFETLSFGLAGVVGFAAFFNFALQFHEWSPGFINRWEMYHYQLGSKYFPELGYDGLYSASLLAQQQSAPDLPVGPLRDLNTNKLVSFEANEPKRREVRERFGENRWQSFVADHRNYIEGSTLSFWKNVRRDHGYNPTPAWTFVARMFDARLGSSDVELAFLASLDIVLMAMMFTVVFRTYGYQVTCLGLAIAGLGFGWRYMYIGSLMRLDWLAAVVVGICSLKRDRFAIAGACFGYAAVVRVFPVLFLAGPALLALKSWLDGERPKWPIRLAAGFAATFFLGLIGGSMTGRGVDAWTEFYDDIRVHRDTWFTNSVGMETLFASGPSFLLRADPVERRTRKEITTGLDEHRIERIVASGAMLALLGLAVWRAPLAESAALGMAAVFALTPAVSYYWIMAVIVPLRRGRWAPLAILSLAMAMYALSRFHPAVGYHSWLYALFAWGNALFLFAWLLPDALRTLGTGLPSRAGG